VNLHVSHGESPILEGICFFFPHKAEYDFIDPRVEGEVRWHFTDVSRAQEAKHLRDENTKTGEAGGRSESGQGSTAVSDPKKRAQL
jgi:hypothetical protein